MTDWVPYSKRKKLAAEAGKPLVYSYDAAPDALRAQVVMILQRALGSNMTDPIFQEATFALKFWAFIRRKLCEEYGLFRLWDRARDDHPDMEVCNFILGTDTDKFLDAVELCLRVVQESSHLIEPYDAERAGIEVSGDEAISNINYRFQENRFGYSYVPDSSQIVRIDSQYLHKEAVEQAFSLLQVSGFAGAENEFQEAHTEYRHGHYKDAITKALNAVESTIKTICDKRKWKYPATASSKDLINIIFEHELVASSQQSFFAALRMVLESGLPTVRNKSTASHGQGATIVTVPQHVAGFALHLAASSIVLLVEASKTKKSK